MATSWDISVVAIGRLGLGRRKTPPIYLDYIRVPIRTTLQNCRLLVPSSWQHVLRDDHLAWFHRCLRASRSIGAGLCMTPSLCRTCQLNKTSPAIYDDTRANTSVDLLWNSISNVTIVKLLAIDCSYPRLSTVKTWLDTTSSDTNVWVHLVSGHMVNVSGAYPTRGMTLTSLIMRVGAEPPPCISVTLTKFNYAVFFA